MSGEREHNVGDWSLAATFTLAIWTHGDRLYAQSTLADSMTDADAWRHSLDAALVSTLT